MSDTPNDEPDEAGAPSLMVPGRWNGPQGAAARRRLRARCERSGHVLELLRALRDGTLPAESPDALP